VCQAATSELRRLLAVGVFTGMRLGDCVTLDWKVNVHLDHNRLIRKTSKTGAVVPLPLHPELRAVLDEVPAGERRGYVCPGLADTYAKDPAAVSKLVRRHFEAAELTTQEARDGIKPARERLDADGNKIVKPQGMKARCVSSRGFHSLRHTFITECARAGVPIGQIRQWVGHASPKITEIYEHWSADASQDRALTRALPSMNGTTVEAEPERDRLAELAKTLPIAAVRRLLKSAAKEAKK
jgi:integrase